jgi:hypothetical protein
MSNTASTSKMISLVPTNGTEFQVEQGQKVIFELPPNLGLVKGRDSHLVLDIVNNASDSRRLGLDNCAGSDSIISRVDIYSLRNGTHLETLVNYNQWVAIANQYLYEDKTNLQTLTGCGNKVFGREYSGFGAPDDNLPVEMRADKVADTILSPINGTTGAPAYNFRRYTTPLKAGILRWWDSEKLCPVLAFGGLRIELTLEDPKVCLRAIRAVKSDGTTIDISAGGSNGIDIPNGQAGANILSTDDFTVEECGFSVGNLVEITSSAATVDTSITALQDNGGKIQFTLADAVPNDGRTGIKIKLRTDTRSAKCRPQFRVLSVAPPQDMISKVSGGFEYEFTTYDYLTSSLLSSALRHQVEINSVATKALCIMSSFTDLSGTQKEQFSSYFSGDPPANLLLNSVQYFLNNRLQPVRHYDPNLTNDKVIAMNELSKAFSSISYEALDLGNAEGKNLEYYTNTFAIARQLAKRPYYFDLKMAEGQIRLGFSGTRTENFTINNYVWSKKIIVISGDGNMEVVL